MIDVGEKYGSIWTRAETTLCFYLYCQTSFSKTNKSNPEVVRLANLLGRTVGSVVRKLGNLGAVDERLRAYNISGLTNYAKLDKEIFEEYVNDWEALALASQEILGSIGKVTESTPPRENIVENDFEADFLRLSNLPTEKQTVVNTRIRQSFFRKVVLSNYNRKCCISGLDVAELLIASHIVPWKEDETLRINPHNGLLLSAIHDKAFDLGLITVTTDYKVQVSRKLYKSKSVFAKPAILDFDGHEIFLLAKFLPKPEFLAWHNKHKFQG